MNRSLAILGLVGGVVAVTASTRADFPRPLRGHPPISDFRSSAISTSATRLTIARLQYDGGGDWYANPSSIPNLLTTIRQRTSLKVEKVEARVRLTDDRLWDFPFLHVTGHGNIR